MKLPAKPVSRPSYLDLALPLLVVTLLSGCQADEIFGASEQTWFWFAIPCLGFGLIGGVLIHYRRKSQLAGWDLGRSPSEPTVRGILLWTVGIALTLAVVFLLYHFRLEIDPRQKLWNVSLWFLGSIVGGAASLLFGLSTAEPKPVNPNPRRS